MSNLSNYQYPPPKHWQDFENLCRDLWREIWKDPNTQKNGRSGQEQHGVDVYGQPSESQLWAGVQCKGKDNYLNKVITERELLDEVEKAKNFNPPVLEWTLATTGSRDAKIQQKAREITEEHEKQGLFSVHVWSWEEIVEELVNHPDLIKKHLPQITNYDPAVVQKINDIELNTKATRADLEQQNVINQASSKTIAEIDKKVEGIQQVRNLDILTPEYNAEIDHARDLVNEHNFKEAIKLLEKLKNRIWTTAPTLVRFRILTNLGSAYYNWGKLEEAGRYFIEAHQYNPDEEIALTNLSIAYSFQSDFEKTEFYARKILEKNPANINAYCILLQSPPYKNSFDKALEFVPDNLKNVAIIAFCLGLSAQTENRFADALVWFETAVKNDTTNNPDFKGYLGAILMQSLWSVSSPILFGQISDEEKQVLNRAIKVLTEAWEQIKNTDLREVHPTWLLNRGIAKKLLGNHSEALDDINKAYEIKPSDPEFVKHLALILVKMEDSDKSNELLEKIRNNKAIPEVSCTLADVYNYQGKSDKALTVINSFLEWNENPKLQFWAYRILVDVYLELGEEDNAQDIADKLSEQFPNNVSTFVSAAKVAKKKNDNFGAIEFLRRGKDLVSPTTPLAELVELGDEFFDLEMPAEAAECYEIFTDIEQDTRFTLRLLISYYNAGILSKALNICRATRNKCGILPKHTEIEIGILEEVNDLPAAVNLATEYLEKFADSLPVKLRLARLNLLLGNFSEVDSFLDENFDIASLPLETGLTISSLFAQRNRIKESFDLMYELRRKYFEEAEAHSFYQANFFSNDKNNADWLHSVTVEANTAVCVEGADGNQKWIVIDDRQDADIQRREFKLNHPLTQNLLGKKVGDEVQLKKSAYNEEVGKIVEIKSKYVYALHETTSFYETMFPERSDFWSIHIGEPDAVNDEGKVNIEKVLNIISGRSNNVREVLNQYQENGFTIGVVGELLGMSGFDTWIRLLGDPQVNLVCSSGNIHSLNAAASALSREKPPRLAADITSIYLARELAVAEEIISYFGKFLISPTTLFSLYRLIEERKRKRASRSFSLSEENGVLYKSIATPEDTEKEIEYLENLVNWIKANCETSPYLSGFDIERVHKTQLREILLPEFFDTALIVKDENYLLFSEDERFRQISHFEFGVQGTSMQPILQVLNDKKLISKEKFADTMVTLASSNMEHISINALTILEAGRKSKWLPTFPFTKVVKRLGNKQSELISSLNVAVQFLFELENEIVLPERHEGLIVSLLANLTFERDRRSTLKTLRQIVRNKFRLLPIQERQIINIINTWEATQSIIR